MSRSPNNPSFSLSTTLSYAGEAYGKLGTNSVDSDTFFKAMGYGGRSGASMSALASLRHFGLIEGRGDNVQLSDLFMKIAAPLDDSEKEQSLYEASRKPAVYNELFKEYNPLPPADILKSIAIRRYGFSENAAKKFVSTILDTEELVKSYKPADNSSQREQPSSVLQTPEAPIVRELESRVIQNPNSIATDTLQFKLSSKTKAEVSFFGPVSKKAIDRLIKHLEFTAEIYDDEEKSNYLMPTET